MDGGEVGAIGGENPFALTLPEGKHVIEVLFDAGGHEVRKVRVTPNAPIDIDIQAPTSLVRARVREGFHVGIFAGGGFRHGDCVGNGIVNNANGGGCYGAGDAAMAFVGPVLTYGVGRFVELALTSDVGYWSGQSVAAEFSPELRLRLGGWFYVGAGMIGGFRLVHTRVVIGNTTQENDRAAGFFGAVVPFGFDFSEQVSLAIRGGAGGPGYGILDASLVLRF